MPDPLTRRQMHEYIARNPGTSARALQRGLGLGWGETAHHLRVLVAAGEILRVRGGRRDYFFPAGTGETDQRILVAFQSPVEREILLALAGEAPLTFVELVGRLRLARSTVAFHVRWLLANGRVEVVRVGSSLHYHATDRRRVRELQTALEGPPTGRWAERFSESWGGLLRD